MADHSELLMTAYEAWNRDDRDGWLELLDPGIVISTSGVFPDLALEYRGLKQAAKFWRQLHEPWGAFRIDRERSEAEEAWVAAAIRFRAAGRDSGVKVDMRFGNAIRVRDGVAIALANRRTLEEARDALGAPDPPVRASRTRTRATG